MESALEFKHHLFTKFYTGSSLKIGFLFLLGGPLAHPYATALLNVHNTNFKQIYIHSNVPVFLFWENRPKILMTSSCTHGVYPLE